MIINLGDSLLEFIANHNLNIEEIEYVSYDSNYNDGATHCSFADLMDVIEEINFEDHDPLIKYREPIKNHICIVGNGWFVYNSSDSTAIWEYSLLPQPMGDYEPISEEDIIDEVDTVDEWATELLTNSSINTDYVRDKITAVGIEYKIDNMDGLEKVVNDDGHVAVILACNPNGQYWSVKSLATKDPQVLYHPELVKIVLEYRAKNPIKGYQLEDGNIAEVFDIDELSTKYNLNFGGITNERFNNLQVIWKTKGYDYVIDLSGAASHEGLHHEVIYPVSSVDVVSI